MAAEATLCKSGHVTRCSPVGRGTCLVPGRLEGDRSPLLVLPGSRTSRTGEPPAAGTQMRCGRTTSPPGRRGPGLVPAPGRRQLVRADPGRAPARRRGRLGRSRPVSCAWPSACLRSHVGGCTPAASSNKDVKPAHILAHAATGEAWLTGFASRPACTRAPGARAAGRHGRPARQMPGNRRPDDRSRSRRSVRLRRHALQMLRSPPVHRHQPMAGSIATSPGRPDAAEEWVHDLPGPITAMVMKLSPRRLRPVSDRRGVAADLRRCLAAWEAHRRIDPFPLGAHDVSPATPPGKAYGRGAGDCRLLAPVGPGRSQRDAGTRARLWAAGIGKSAVVQNSTGRCRARPLRVGEVRPGQAGHPVSTLAKPSRASSPLLGRNEAELGTCARPSGRHWPHGQTHRASHSLSSRSSSARPARVRISRRRTRSTASNSVPAVSQRPRAAGHPLALFLDDLQWLDAATLDLLAHYSPTEVRHCWSSAPTGQRSQSLATR